MKTCRFCNHEQEEGDRCEACGSPFSADKLDFSGGIPCEILPSWGNAGEIILLQPDLKSECGPWQELLK